MTQQIPDILTVECDLDLGDLMVHSLLLELPKSGEETKQYRFNKKPTEAKRNVMTACWDGYVSEYTITQDRKLFLTGFTYLALLPERIEPDSANEQATGDFWLGLHSSSSKESTYIPFINGTLVLDKNEWTTVSGNRILDTAPLH